MIVALGFFVLATIDRLLKTSSFVQPRTQSLIEPLLELHSSVNAGGLFGIFFPYLLLVITTIAVGCLFVWLAYREPDRLARFFFLLVALGIFSNGYDRLVYGYVLDTFRFAHMLSFNLADLYIVGGLIGIGFCLQKKTPLVENAKLT